MQEDRSEARVDDGFMGGDSGSVVIKVGSGFVACQLPDEEGEPEVGATAGGEGSGAIAKIGKELLAVRGGKAV